LKINVLCIWYVLVVGGGGGQRNRESAYVVNCEIMTLYLYCALLHLHSDLKAWIIEVLCVVEVDSFLVASSQCKVWGPPSVLPELPPLRQKLHVMKLDALVHALLRLIMR